MTLGLSAIFLYSPAIYTTIKFLGCAYLVYLGILTFKSSELFQHADGVSAESEVKNKYQFFNQGVLTEILNPKTSVFFLSFLPQFVDSAQGSTTLQLFIFGLESLCDDRLQDLHVPVINETQKP